MATKKKVAKKKPVPKAPSFPEVLYVRFYEEDDWDGEPYLVHGASLGELLDEGDDAVIMAEYHLVKVGEAVKTVSTTFYNEDE